MRHLLPAFVFFLYNFGPTSSFEDDYYWRQYTGTIPADAIIGGKDINGKNVHIGQVYMKNWGIFVAEIHPGVSEVRLHLNGKLYNLDSYIKILCGVQQNFYWEPANETTLHLQLIDRHAIVGGHLDGYGSLNVGRISMEGDTKIGRILAYNAGKARMHFTHKSNEKSAPSYEVLLYKQIDFDIRLSPNQTLAAV